MDDGGTNDHDRRSERPIRLLIVEDHAALGEALKFAFGFEPGIETIGVAPTISRALEMTRAEQPAAVLMDVRLPDGTGLDAVSEVLAIRPGAAVVIMTAHADHEDALRAADGGAAGFIIKDVRIAKIVGGVRRAVAGEPAIDPNVLQSVLAQAAAEGSPTGRPGAPSLSPRELRLAELLARGSDRVAIAADLGIAPDQVAVLMISLQERLDARSPLEAVVRAARFGLLDGPNQDSRARTSTR